MRTLLLAAALVPALMLPACTTAPSDTPGAASVKTNNVTGTMSTTLTAPLEKSYRATLRAIDDMKYTTTTKALDAMKGVVSARTADGTAVDITLEKNGDSLTKVVVSAGPGKTDVSRELLDKIQERTTS